MDHERVRVLKKMPEWAVESRALPNPEIRNDIKKQITTFGESPSLGTGVATLTLGVDLEPGVWGLGIQVINLIRGHSGGRWQEEDWCGNRESNAKQCFNQLCSLVAEDGEGGIPI